MSVNLFNQFPAIDPLRLTSLDTRAGRRYVARLATELLRITGERGARDGSSPVAVTSGLEQPDAEGRAMGRCERTDRRPGRGAIRREAESEPCRLR